MNSSVKDALDFLRRGRPVILVDDGASRSALYLIISAEKASSEAISLLVCESRGVVCAAIPELRLRELMIPPMPGSSNSGGPEFSVSVEARQGVKTGISAADRAQTLRILATTTDPRRELVTPGHIFPTPAKTGGVLVRVAPVEAVVDILTLAGLNPVGAYAHCLGDQGQMLSLNDLDSLTQRTKAPVVKISDIVRIRLGQETVVEMIADSHLPTEAGGEFRAVCFRSKIDNAEHLALVKGNLGQNDDSGLQLPVLVRVHAENRLGDLLGAPATQTRERLNAALQQINEAGRGVLVYIRHPRRGLLQREVGELALRDHPPPPAASRMREYGIGSQILVLLGVKRIQLLTNSNWAIPAISAFNLEITGSVSFNQNLLRNTNA